MTTPFPILIDHVDDVLATHMNQAYQVINSLESLLQTMQFGTPPSIFQARLTLQSGVPVPAADQMAAGTLYLTPYQGAAVGLYDGVKWVILNSGEPSLSLAALPANTNHDVFAYLDSGAVKLEALAWTNDTARAETLASHESVMSKASDPTRRYVGTIRTAAIGQCEDSDRKRFVWNYQNRVARRLKVTEANNSWTYTTASLRPFNNSLLNRVELVTGLAELPTTLDFKAFGVHSGGLTLYVGIGLDSISASTIDLSVPANSNTITLVEALIHRILPEGYHYLQLLEIGASTITWYGDYGATFFQSGAVGTIYA